MISKVQRKSSRFYNVVLRKSMTDMTRRQSANVWKQRMFKNRREAKARLAPESVRLSIPPIVHQREQKAVKRSLINWLSSWFK